MSDGASFERFGKKELVTYHKMKIVQTLFQKRMDFSQNNIYTLHTGSSKKLRQLKTSYS